MPQAGSAFALKAVRPSVSFRKRGYRALLMGPPRRLAPGAITPREPCARYCFSAKQKRVRVRRPPRECPNRREAAASKVRSRYSPTPRCAVYPFSVMLRSKGIASYPRPRSKAKTAVLGRAPPARSRAGLPDRSGARTEEAPGTPDEVRDLADPTGADRTGSVGDPRRTLMAGRRGSSAAPLRGDQRLPARSPMGAPVVRSDRRETASSSRE
jgi:hypothetical protein